MIEENGIYMYGSPEKLGCAIYQLLSKKIGDEK